MKNKAVLEFSEVKMIAAAAEAEAVKHQWAVTIAIVDDGGHLLSLQRLDGAAPLSAHIAPAKAHTAAMGRRESKFYEDVINQGRTAFLTAPAINGMLEGGVAIMKDGECLGAVGVSVNGETNARRGFKDQWRRCPPGQSERLQTTSRRSHPPRPGIRHPS